MKYYHLIIGICFSLTLLFADSTIITKGYFKENGSYIKPRSFNPLIDSELSRPILSESLQLRKKQISSFYEGQIMTSRISFPACEEGATLYIDNINKGNIETFDNIVKYGSSLEKGDVVLITDFTIGSNYINIELNAGGYGNTKDIAGRVIKDVLTLGIAELAIDYQIERFKSGSRLRIILNSLDDNILFTKFDIDSDKFIDTIQTENGYIYNYIFENKNASPTSDEILAQMNQLLLERELYKNVAVPKYRFNNNEKYRYEILTERLQKEEQLIKNELFHLNLTLLKAMLPTSIFKSTKFPNNLFKIFKRQNCLVATDIDFVILEKEITSSSVLQTLFLTDNISHKGTFDLTNKTSIVETLNDLLSTYSISDRLNPNDCREPSNAKTTIEKITELKKRESNNRAMIHTELIYINKIILCALYPQHIKKNRTSFTLTDLTFENIDYYLSFALQSNN